MDFPLTPPSFPPLIEPTEHMLTVRFVYVERERGSSSPDDILTMIVIVGESKESIEIELTLSTHDTWAHCRLPHGVKHMFGPFPAPMLHSMLETHTDILHADYLIHMLEFNFLQVKQTLIAAEPLRERRRSYGAYISVWLDSLEHQLPLN